MVRCTHILRLGAALLVAAVASGAALAGSVPFSAEVTYQLVGSEGPLDIWNGAGSATQMGPVTAVTRDYSTAAGRRHKGTGVMTAASGDSLFASYQVAGDDGQWTGTWTIDGGTGRFAGASGGGSLTIILLEPGVVHSSFTGTLIR